MRRAVQQMLAKSPTNLQALRVAMVRDELAQLRFGRPVDVPRLVRAITGLSIIVPVRGPERTAEVLSVR